MEFSFLLEISSYPSLLVTYPVEIAEPHSLVGKPPGIGEDIRSLQVPGLMVKFVYQHRQTGQGGCHCPDMLGFVLIEAALAVEDFSLFTEHRYETSAFWKSVV